MLFRSWDDGKTRVFKNLSGCSQSYERGRFFPSFKCKNGYVQVTDPLGTKLCELQGYDVGGLYISENVIWHRENGRVRFGNEYPCKEL